MLSWLETTSLALWVRESLWGWPITLTAHAVGTAMVVGIIFVTSLRLFGFFQPIPYGIVNRLLALAWIGIAINVISGFSLFTSNATNYAVAGSFIVKMAFVISGIVVTWYMQKIARRDAMAWQAAGAVSPLGLKLAIGSFAIWTCVLVTGRLMAYLGLYD